MAGDETLDAPQLPATASGEEPAQTLQLVDRLLPSSTSTRLPRIPGYEILGELARGGMGVVYRAREVLANRDVAIKLVLSGQYASSGELARFRTEAEAAASIQHPGVVQVLVVGEHDGHPFLCMEFCGGGSLEQRLEGGPLPPRDAVKLVAQLADAVHAAHDRRVVHRDLKPANVLFTADGRPKITDFGLAKRLDGAGGLTASGAVIGTPNYMAPEQAAGLAHEVGPAADVYGLGAVLYRCLTGRPPFQADSLTETLFQVLHREPDGPRAADPRVPRDLDGVCLKCLAKRPAGRYATAAELAADLRCFLDGRPVLAQPVGRLALAGRWVRRNRVVLLALVFSGLLGVVATFAALVVAALSLRGPPAAAGGESTEETASLQLAYQKLEAEQYDEARELFRTTAEKYPRALTWIHAGDCLWRQGKLEDADVYYHRGLGVDPNHAGANHALGRDAVLLKKYDRAVPYLERANDGLKGTGLHAQNLRFLAEALLRLGWTDRAQPIVEELRRDHPNDPNTAEAVSLLTTADGRNPADVGRGRR